MRGLEREPGKRYPDALAFAQALRDAVAQPQEPEHRGLVSRLKSVFGKGN
jgi:hypothetical protein